MDWTPPPWWHTYEQQCELFRQNWPGITPPEPPETFTRQTASEVPLLHMPGTFAELWDKVVAPEGYTKPGWMVDKAGDLRIAPNKIVYTEPVWLAFDPDHGHSQAPYLFWDNPNSIASEVLSALIQFPEWPLTWINGSSPMLMGYQLFGTDPNSSAPYLTLWRDTRQLAMDCCWARHARQTLSSPTVRKC